MDIVVIALAVIIVVVVVVLVRRNRKENKHNSVAVPKRKNSLDVAEGRYKYSIPSARFSVVHDPSEMLQAIRSNIGVDDFRDEPPLLEGIYLSAVTADSLVITAGNRTITHWNITVTVKKSAAGGTDGVVALDRSRSKVLKWVGNVNDIFGKVWTVVTASDANATYAGDNGTRAGV